MEGRQEQTGVSRRATHLAWAKARALAYLDSGNILNAVNSMLRDCDKNFELATHPALMTGVTSLPHWLNQGAREDVRRWIEGFH
jgi:hypothetical protein